MSSGKSLVFFVCIALHWSAAVLTECNKDEVMLRNADTTLNTLESPGFPRGYPSNSYCQWLISAPDDNYVVRVDTMAMDLESSSGCIYDGVTLYDGDTQEAVQLRRYCAGMVSVYSTGRHMLVVFKSDGNVEKGGFQLRYFALAKNPTTVKTTTASYTSTERYKRDENWVNTGALIGGVVGGVCFVVLMGIICGRCMGSGGPRQPPVHRPAAFYHSHAPPAAGTPLHGPGDGSAISAAVHMVQNNNAVFMVSQAVGSNVSPTRFTSHITAGGVTNLAFDSSTGDPSASGISALGSSAIGLLGPPVGVPPPTYNEAMLTTHPPAVPPTPHHTSSQPDGSAGLAPPPLRAPRETSAAVSESGAPGPSSSDGGRLDTSLPATVDETIVSVGAVALQPIQSISGRASASAPCPPVPPAGAKDEVVGDEGEQKDLCEHASVQSPSDPETMIPPTACEARSLHTQTSGNQGCAPARHMEHMGSERSRQGDGMSAERHQGISHSSETHTAAGGVMGKEPVAGSSSSEVDEDRSSSGNKTSDAVSAQRSLAPDTEPSPTQPSAEGNHTGERRITVSQQDVCQGSTGLQPSAPDAENPTAPAEPLVSAEVRQDLNTEQDSGRMSLCPNDSGEAVALGISDLPTAPSVEGDEGLPRHAELTQTSGNTSKHPPVEGDEGLPRHAELTQTSGNTSKHPPVTPTAATASTTAKTPPQTRSSVCTHVNEPSKELSPGSFTARPPGDGDNLSPSEDIPPGLPSLPSAQRTASASSLPPPPSPYSPHSSAGCGSDVENFPPPPTPLAGATDGDLQPASDDIHSRVPSAVPLPSPDGDSPHTPSKMKSSSPACSLKEVDPCVSSGSEPVTSVCKEDLAGPPYPSRSMNVTIPGSRSPPGSDSPVCPKIDSPTPRMESPSLNAEAMRFPASDCVGLSDILSAAHSVPEVSVPLGLDSREDSQSLPETDSYLDIVVKPPACELGDSPSRPASNFHSTASPSACRAKSPLIVVSPAPSRPDSPAKADSNDFLRPDSPSFLTDPTGTDFPQSRLGGASREDSATFPVVDPCDSTNVHTSLQPLGDPAGAVEADHPSFPTVSASDYSKTESSGFPTTSQHTSPAPDSRYPSAGSPTLPAVRSLTTPAVSQTADCPDLLRAESPVSLKANCSGSNLSVASDTLCPAADSPGLSLPGSPVSGSNIPLSRAGYPRPQAFPGGQYAQDSTQPEAMSYRAGEEGCGGEDSHEWYAGRMSLGSLSSSSSPLLTERQLRNSTSFPDLTGQAEVATRRDPLQRADTCH